jgi:integrase
MNFKKQADTYMTQIQTRRRNPVASATVASYQCKLDKWLLPFFGHKDLSEIDNGLVKAFVQKLSENGLSASTISVTFNVLKQIVASAVDANGNRLYERSWNSEFLDLPVISQSEQKAPCAAPSAIQAAIKQASGQDKALYALLAGTGLRVGEALALTASDWDRQNMTLSVTKTIVKGHTQDSTKTIAGTRIVDLTPELNAFLTKHIPHTDGLLFRSANGGVVRQMSAYSHLEKVGIPGFHSLRRFRETYLETVGVPRMLMKFWTGHAASDISERYIKFGPDVQARKQWAVKAGLGFTL